MPEQPAPPDHPEPGPVERLPGTADRATAVVGVVVVLALAGAVLADGFQRGDLVVLSAAVLGAVVLWLVYARPAVLLVDDLLVLRGFLGQKEVPLVAVTRVEVGRMLIVTTGDRRHVSPVMRRPRRRPRTGDSALGGLGGGFGRGLRGRGTGFADLEGRDLGHERSAVRHADYVETRLEGLARDARVAAGQPANPRPGDPVPGLDRIRTRIDAVPVGLAVLGLAVVLAGFLLA